MRRRPLTAAALALGASAAAALFAAGAVTACNAISGVGDFVVGDFADSSSGPDATAGEGGSSPDVVDLTDGSTADVDARGGDDGPPGNADGPSGDVGPGEVDGGDAGNGRDGEPATDAPVDSVVDTGNDASTDAPGDAGSDAPATEAGSSGPCDGGPPIAHSNGLGQTYYDCAPLGTYTATQALEACVAATADAGACVVDPVTCSGSSVMCAVGANCICWRYGGTRAGLVAGTGSSTCNCPGLSSATWN